jgi:hypothetical protein
LLILLSARSLLLAILLTLLAATAASAQDPPRDTLVPIRPMFGVGLDEFYIGAWCFMHPSDCVSWSGAYIVNDATGIDSLWKFAGEMGFNILRPQLHGNVPWVDRLAESHRFDIPGREFRFYIHPAQYTAEDFYATGFGREVKFYPFDSAQSPFFPAIFTHYAGVSRYDSAEGGAQERWFTRESATPGSTVVSGILFNRGVCDLENRSDFLTESTLGGRIAGTISLSVLARLVGDSHGSADTTPVMVVQLRHLIGRGEQYLASTPRGVAPVHARNDTAILCDTVLVRRGELRDDSACGRYREIWRRKSLVVRDDGGPGPFDPRQPPPDRDRPSDGGSLDFDLRVVWLGPDGVALRSVAMRDTLAELILGRTAVSDAYREHLRSSTRRLLVGPDSTRWSWRDRIIGVLSGIEQQRMNYAGFAAISNFLRRSFNRNGDSLTAHTEDAASFHFHHLTRPDGVFPEIGVGIESGVQGALELPYEQLPQIAQHNGGRFRDPYARRRPELLELSVGAIERYEEMLQRGVLTRYDPDRNCYPYHTGTAHHLGIAASISRRTGRRMIPVVFAMGGGLEKGRDELFMARVPEAAELRALVMMGLCYGARGVLWTQIGSDLNLLHEDPEGSGVWVGGTDSWGAGGPRIGDTTLDRAEPLVLTGARDTVARVSIPDVWVGHRSRTREIRELDRWLAKIGPVLTHLRWHNSYSIYYTARTPRLRRDLGTRPIAPGEIVTGITTRPLHVLRPAVPADDPPYRTFVELGLFEPRRSTDTSGLPGDTATIFLVNRRAFERPIDVDPASPEGRRMDTLAESRRLTVALARLFPSLPSLVRVREIAPDTRPLPLGGARRVGLDTVIVDGGSFSIDLGPGGGALIELTRLPVELLGRALVRRGPGRQRLVTTAGAHDVEALAGPVGSVWRDPLRDLRQLIARPLRRDSGR